MTTRKEIYSNNTITTKPEYYGQTGRALVWYQRHRAAYQLAQRVCEPDAVTEGEKAQAMDLLNSVVRYALKDARQWERANTFERYANSRQCKEDEARNDRTREKLQKRLARYGVKLENYGLYPSTVDASNGENLYLLYYFE